MTTATRGYWYSAGSYARNEYPRGVARHAEPAPATWRENRARLERFARKMFGDISDVRYSGGVLRFRWNGGEGSGEVYESPTTPGPVGDSA